MSDCFDHEADAWDQHINMTSVGEFDGSPRHNYDPNYYHCWIGIDGIRRETEKAIQILFRGLEFWIARSLIRKIRNNEILVHSATFNSIVIRKIQEVENERVGKTGGCDNPLKST